MKGFTLLEVLVALLIMLLGMLGIAGLIVRGQQAGHEAYQRQAALTMAGEMAEKIKANPSQALAYAAGAPAGTPVGDGTLFDLLTSFAITACTGSDACTPSALMTYDLATWDGQLIGAGKIRGVLTDTATAANSVGGLLNGRGCVEELLPAPALVGGQQYRNLRVSVTWQGNMDTVAPVLSTCAAAVYDAETRRRLVTADLTICGNC